MCALSRGTVDLPFASRTVKKLITLHNQYRQVISQHTCKTRKPAHHHISRIRDIVSGAGKAETTREMIQKTGRASRRGKKSRITPNMSLLNCVDSYALFHISMFFIDRDHHFVSSILISYCAKLSNSSSFPPRHAQRPATMFRTPPSTAMISPLTYVFLVKNSTACAISSSWPARPCGTWPFSWIFSSGTWLF